MSTFAEFFLQAANLESRQHDLNATMENVKLLISRLQRAEDGMADKRAYAEQCAAEYEGAVKLKALNAKMEEFGFPLPAVDAQSRAAADGLIV